MHKPVHLTLYIGILLIAICTINWSLTETAYSAQAPMTSSVPLSEEIYIPAGQFPMGCSPDTTDGISCAIDAQPIHVVYLDAFYIDKTEVSNAQYAECVNDGACLPPIEVSSSKRPEYFGNSQFDNYPVIHMDWDRANTYCHWIGKRLPTEAEWEKAARGTDMRLFPWGNDEATCEKMNFTETYTNPQGEPRSNICVGDTTPVHSYANYPSPYGALNMTGNAQEWVNDLYTRRYYATSPYYNPQGPETTVAGEHHIRGGAWPGYDTHANTWVRLDEADIYTTELNGFRCARTAAEGNPTPTLPPTPIPTPTPFAAKNIGPEGGALWLNTSENLTLITIKEDVLSTSGTITLSYEEQEEDQGELQGIHHFFALHADAPGSSAWLPPHFPTPVQLILGFPQNNIIMPNTLGLYRLTSQGWVTDGINISIEGKGYALADVQWPGIYGLLGQTHKIYLPLMIRN